MGLLVAPTVFNIDSMNWICKYEERCQLSNIYFRIKEQLWERRRLSSAFPACFRQKGVIRYYSSSASNARPHKLKPVRVLSSSYYINEADKKDPKMGEKGNNSRMGLTLQKAITSGI